MRTGPRSAWLLLLGAGACADDPEPRPDRGFRTPPVLEPEDAGASEHPCGHRLTGSGPVTLEVHTSSVTWGARLEGCYERVGFDDVAVSNAPVAIASDRYASRGLILTAPNRGGQYVHPDFGLPSDFRAVSAPNVFAPGPKNSESDRGGYRTLATFVVGGRAARVAGLGAFFLDTDYPHIKLSGLTARDARGQELGPFEAVSGPSGSRLFLGVIAVSGERPVAAIHSVELETGDGWVEAAELNEVVALDDVVFALPSLEL